MSTADLHLANKLLPGFSAWWVDDSGADLNGFGWVIMNSELFIFGVMWIVWLFLKYEQKLGCYDVTFVGHYFSAFQLVLLFSSKRLNITCRGTYRVWTKFVLKYQSLHEQIKSSLLKGSIALFLFRTNFIEFIQLIDSFILRCLLPY